MSSRAFCRSGVRWRGRQTASAYRFDGPRTGGASPRRARPAPCPASPRPCCRRRRPSPRPPPLLQERNRRPPPRSPTTHPPPRRPAVTTGAKLPPPLATIAGLPGPKPIIATRTGPSPTASSSTARKPSSGAATSRPGMMALNGATGAPRLTMPSVGIHDTHGLAPVSHQQGEDRVHRRKTLSTASIRIQDDSRSGGRSGDSAPIGM